LCAVGREEIFKTLKRQNRSPNLDVSDDDESGTPPLPRYRHRRITAIATMGKALPRQLPGYSRLTDEYILFCSCGIFFAVVLISCMIPMYN